MKKHMVIAFSSLVLATGLNASQKAGGEHCFRPAFQKKLKRLNPVGFGSFNAKRRKDTHKKAVFIDWRKLYWGKLGDLIYSEEEALIVDDLQKIAGIEEQHMSSLDSQESQDFAGELRQELKSFARQYGLKIVWRRKSPGIIDGTAAFLEYWDKGLSESNPHKAVPFAELCALSVKNTAASDRGVKQKPKGSNTQSSRKGCSLEVATFSNPFLKEKEA
jgi:hypothetical protein